MHSMRKGIHKRWLAILVASALSTACATTPHAGDVLKTAEHVNIEHFMGRWYVISGIPNSTENGRVGPYIEYADRVDHRIDVTYFFHQTDFDHPLEQKKEVATIADIQSNAIWKTRFGQPISSDFRILYVDPEYRYAVIGQPSRDYAWVLARDMYISDDDYQQLLSILNEQGFDSGRLLKFAPREEFMGIPGYQ